MKLARSDMGTAVKTIFTKSESLAGEGNRKYYKDAFIDKLDAAVFAVDLKEKKVLSSIGQSKFVEDVGYGGLTGD